MRRNNYISFIIILLLNTYLFAQIPSGYYDGTQGLSGEELKSALNDIISGHIEYSYDALRDYILPDTDEDPENSSNVILIYTGWSRAKDEFGGGASNWNREHVWAKSHGDFGTAPPEGTDAHHIRACDTSVNSARGNLDFDNGGNEFIDGDGATGCFRDSDSWEPRDEAKGDIARMIFYMEVRYQGEGGEHDLEMVDYIPSSPDGEPYHALKSTLLQWHQQDPVDDPEIQRNDRIYSYQENRNPFIDHPEFVDMIWNPVSADEDQLSFHDYKLSNHPNPFKSFTTIYFNISRKDAGLRGTTPEQAEIVIYNIKGQKIKTFPVILSGVEGQSSIVWDGTDQTNKPVSSGIYFYKLKTGKREISRKMLLLK